MSVYMSYDVREYETDDAVLYIVDGKKRWVPKSVIDEEDDNDPEFEQAILDGYAWLGRYFTVRVNPGRAPFMGGSYHYTYLYALERCGDIGRREVIGGRSWFAEGARYLLKHQAEDGSFLDPTCMNPKDVLGTAFAMLFLTRASKPVSG